MNKTPITIYAAGSMFGCVHQTEASYLKHGTHPFAQYAAVPYVDFIPTGKRKPRRIQGEGYKPFLLVLHGHGHPRPGEMMVRTPHMDTDGIESSMSRYSSFSIRWKTDFNALINPLLERCPELVLLDARWTKTTDPEEGDPDYAVQINHHRIKYHNGNPSSSDHPVEASPSGCGGLVPVDQL